LIGARRMNLSRVLPARATCIAAFCLRKAAHTGPCRKKPYTRAAGGPTGRLEGACFNRTGALSTMAPLRNAIRAMQSAHKLEVRK
jgi:hypothetical protein